MLIQKWSKVYPKGEKYSNDEDVSGVTKKTRSVSIYQHGHVIE